MGGEGKGKGKEMEKEKKERKGKDPFSDHISSNGSSMTSKTSSNTRVEPTKPYQKRDWLYGILKHH